MPRIRVVLLICPPDFHPYFIDATYNFRGGTVPRFRRVSQKFSAVDYTTRSFSKDN
jgi:hypothetical protein